MCGVKGFFLIGLVEGTSVLFFGVVEVCLACEVVVVWFGFVFWGLCFVVFGFDWCY